MSDEAGAQADAGWRAREGARIRTAEEAERFRAAVADLLADDDMPRHWSDCVCSYCRAYRAVKAFL